MLYFGLMVPTNFQQTNIRSCFVVGILGLYKRNEQQSPGMLRGKPAGPPSAIMKSYCNWYIRIQTIESQSRRKSLTKIMHSLTGRFVFHCFRIS